MTAKVESLDDYVSQMKKDLQSWWEIPSMAQYISLFREPFNLPEIEIEELEKGFLDDTLEGPSTWLQNLIISFLKSILVGRGVNSENWEFHLRKLVKRKCQPGEQNPFDDDKSFQDLNIRSKVVIVYSLCLYRLDRNDIAESMKSMDAEALRVQKLGVDDQGNTYWYFYGTRLYKEEAEETKSWDKEWKKQKKKSFKKRGRGRPRKRVLQSDGESDASEDCNSSKNDGYMNANEKSRWSVVCDTIEEWVTFAEKFKNSKSKNEIGLFKIIQGNFLPTLNKIYEEKEKKLQDKLRELMPMREKIITRRETRKLRGEDYSVDYSALNGYDSDDASAAERVIRPVKDRAQRLEERNKRASEATLQSSCKRSKTDDDGNDLDSSKSEDSSFHLQSQMEKLLTSVKLHKDAWPFLYPVNEDDAPGYYDIIKEPVDLSVIESKLYKGEYDTVGDLDSDFSKMVSNCELYNGEYHAYSKMAQMLRIAFRKGVAKILDYRENANMESEGSSDSQYHSKANTVSSFESPPTHSKHRDRKKSKEKNKKRAARALDLLEQATDIVVQDNSANKTSPPQKKSPVPQPSQPAPNVPPTSMSYIPPSTSNSTNQENRNPVQSLPKLYTYTSKGNNTKGNISNLLNSSKRPSLPPTTTTTANFISVNASPQVTSKARPVIIRTKKPENEAKVPVSNVPTTSYNVVSTANSNNVTSSQSIVQLSNSKPVPVVYSYNNSSSPSAQSDLRFKNTSNTVTTVQPNVCMPNGLPMVQQVFIPAGSQQFQLPNGQYVIASPQNTIRLYNKEQNVQVLKSVGQGNQGFPKVVPQFLTSAPVQFQTYSQNNAQTFTQVNQNSQIVNIPTYMLTNQNMMSDSSAQSVMNLQPYQVSQRQMHISGQGNV